MTGGTEGAEEAVVTATVTDVGTIPKISHPEGMGLAETEYRRLLEVVDQLADADWSQATDWSCGT
jgi:hypothetical protein